MSDFDDMRELAAPEIAELTARITALEAQLAAAEGALVEISKSNQYLPGYGSRVAPTHDAKTAVLAIAEIRALRGGGNG